VAYATSIMDSIETFFTGQQDRTGEDRGGGGSLTSAILSPELRSSVRASSSTFPSALYGKDDGASMENVLKGFAEKIKSSGYTSTALPPPTGLLPSQPSAGSAEAAGGAFTRYLEAAKR